MDREALDEFPPAELSDAIGQLHALTTAAQRTLLELVAHYDRRESWHDDGATSMAGWLVAYLGLSHATATTWVRVAKALEHLPAIATAFVTGRLSFDQVAALTEFATPATDEALAQQAQGCSAAELAALARRSRACREEGPDGPRRSLRWWWDESEWLRLQGHLPAADGAVVVAALDRLVDQAPADAATGLFHPYDARLADALVELASTRIATDADADRATVVVHVDAELLTGGQGVAEVDGAGALPAEVARRLACDARIEVVAHSPDGAPIGIGRTRRQPPPWLRRQLRHRDRGCRFPRCGRTRWCSSHHVWHWTKGGPTDMDNLLLMCGHHHGLLHTGGWRVTGNPDGDVTFIRPDGRPLRPGPPPLRPEVGQRLAASGLAPWDTS